jgi:hypothetical protein
MFTLSKLGLVLNFVGTVMICISFGENPGGANQNDKKGRKIFLASFLHPKLFYYGLVIIAIGFFLQIIA